jgi:hypothetical protein
MNDDFRVVVTKVPCIALAGAYAMERILAQFFSALLRV